MNRSRQEFLRALGFAGLGLATRASLPAAEKVGSEPASVWPEFNERQPEPFWAAVRAAYQFEPGLAYLNTGGLGPVADPVLAETAAVEAALQQRVESGHERRTAAREPVARFLGCKPEHLAFVRNATEGNGIIAAGLDLRAGDEVIFETHAHPGGSFPWLHLARRRGIVVKTFEPDPLRPEGNVARVEALLTPRTRVVQVSHVTAPTGLIMPVRELARLCRDRGAWLHVDGAQSAGMLPLNLAELGCDSYATSGHKWLGGPRETGLLVIRPERLDDVQPPLVGAYSGDVDRSSGAFTLNPTAERFEYGTRDNAAIVGLAAAVAWQERIGRERLYQRDRWLVARLRRGLKSIPDVEVLTPEDPSYGSVMLTFRSSRVPFDRLFDQLMRGHGLRCRPVSEVGLNAVRVSCHFFNTPEEIDRLLTAIAQVLRAA